MIDEVKAASTEGIEFAYFLDCFEEERAQNITIDTTQTFFKSKKRRYVIIDAPGHKEFLRNMVSGASLANAAVLMVDVTRGMEEQTRRHANVLRLLGLKEVLVAVNKMDAVEYNQADFQRVEGEVREFFSRIGLEPRVIIPISARKGDNIATTSTELPWYKGQALIEALDELPEPASLAEQDTRFPVQDIYDIEGEKVLVGRVESGKLVNGQSVKLMPSGKSVTVTGLRVMEGAIPSAEVGECIGLTVSDTAGLGRGEVLCGKTEPTVTKNLETILFAMTDKPMRTGETYTFECATQSIPCKISKVKRLINSSTLEVVAGTDSGIESTHAAEVELTLDRPAVLENFTDVASLGRFVLAQDNETIGAGIVQS